MKTVFNKVQREDIGINQIPNSYLLLLSSIYVTYIFNRLYKIFYKESIGDMLYNVY